MSVIQYVASDAGTFPEDAYFLDPRHIDELTSEWEFESLAQDAALDYFDNHDGWSHLGRWISNCSLTARA
jgi:hypothetical protein